MEKKMGVIPDYEDDIFISYTYVDNAKDNQGWVDDMHERLEQRLYLLLGESPKICKPPKQNDHTPPIQSDQLRNIAIMVAVLSPGYVNSEDRNELMEFYRNSGYGDRARSVERAPIFKVVKRPVDDKEYPSELRELLSYKFYEEDPHSGQANELRHDRSRTSQKFLQRVNDLAKGIKLFIDTLQETPSGRLLPPRGRTVYLAVTTGDLEDERDNIKRELQAHGHRVLPERDLPPEPENLMKRISEDLGKSDLSIHVIGKHYDRPESLTQLQHKLALDRALKGKFSEVIWIPKGSKVSDDDRQQLINSLRHDVNTHAGIEIFQDMLEDLKTNILVKLKRIEDASQHSQLWDDPEPTKDAQLSIYLVNDDVDYDATAKLRNFLFDQKIKVLQIEPHEPNGEPKQTAELLRLRRDYTQNCDAVIIFQAQATDIWRGQKVSELRKCKVGRAKPLLGQAVYLSHPITPLKETFKSAELDVIKDHEEVLPKSLFSFLEQVKNRFQVDVSRMQRAGK